MKKLLNIHYHQKTKRKSINMEKVVRKLAVCCLLLFAFAGSVAAQNDPLHVIKKDGHYLAHVYDETVQDWVLQNVDEFGPNCLWHSGNTVNVLGLHHNYYFIDGNGNYRFLSAPLQANGTLSLSASLPSIQLLRNTDQIYYFYDWDADAYGAGVARGHKHTGYNENTCEHSWHWFNEDDHSQGGECWQVYWLEYSNDEWKLTSESHYSRLPEDDGGNDGVPNAGLYRSVTASEHPMEIVSETGGAGDLTITEEMEYGDDQGLSVSVSSYSYTYTPAYTTYVFEGGTHNYYNDGDQGTNTPDDVTSSGNTVSSYEWTISGEGAEFLSFASGSDELTSDDVAPTLYYIHQNTTGHKWAVITVTITYTHPNNGSTSIQVRTAMVLVKTSCHNPAQSSAPVITYEGVTVSWYPTAESYLVSWKKASETTWTSVGVGEVQSYHITGLDYDTDYQYKVEAACTPPDPNPAAVFSFHTCEQPGLLVYGAVFGGGRMGDVVGKTEVAIINCDSIHAVYGGNDIAKTVSGDDGATITIGVETDDPNDFDDFGTTNAPIRIGDVYGGGNGYYAYNGTSFEPASYNTVYTIADEASIVEMTPLHQLGETAWTNTTGSDVELVCPTIKKTKITVTNDYVKIDSLFGGAKNAILNATSDDVTVNINGGTIFTVFGGNNFGGSLGYQSQERILVTHTTTKTGNDYHNGTLGRDFGIGYLFGGGNKVQGQNVYVTVEGGQIDTIFGGGNEADVRSTEVRIQCALGALANGVYGQVYTNALGSYSGGDLTNNAINGSYRWDRSGIYNVRTLFGGNNRASMEGVPTLLLTSGGIGTVYGGGNEGDMLAQEETTILAPNTYGNDPVSMNVKYGTHVQMNSPNILVDLLYGGCQKSNVDYSTWTEIMGGHVGTVYGGCNISGDVGSTRLNPAVPSNPPSEAYQAVQGGTYVKATGGVVHNHLFGGSNGFYHCNNGISYIEGVTYCPPENYVGWAIPTHNETHVIVTENALIKKNVYAGGNMSPVGFTDATVGERPFPQFVGLASLRMDGGEVEGDVFGGGNMASILGGNEVIVSGGSIGMTETYDGALYGGNDRSGQVGQISNRVFPEGYDVASDGYTSLTDVNTYVSLTGKPDINTVYGGGNGDYDYVNGDDVIPAGQYCSYDGSGVFNDKPIQTNTFVDINITGNNNDGNDGGHINTVYGGGNGVTVYGSITVFLNIKDPNAYDHVGTIFGGNNKDNVVEFDNAPLVPDIILLHGQVGTVYGGCNRGAMTTGKDFTIGGNTYRNVGSMVRLRSTYQATPNAPAVTPDAVVSHAVYGGCRMNDVYNNSLVLVEGGADVPANLFGGCDISGAVGNTSLVVVTDGQVNGNIYAGGNGNYIYNDDGTVNSIEDPSVTVATEVTNAPPTSSVSRVDILGGQVGVDATHIAEVFGGGYGQLTNTTGDVIVNIGPETASGWTGLPTIYGNVYGGSAFGSVNYNSNNTEATTSVSFLNGTLHGNLYGGALGRQGNDPIAAKVYGKVFVTISTEDQAADNCFIDLRDADIYGCNNQNGSPQDDVRVDVWKTAFNYSDYLEGDKYIASYAENDASYAIDEVFGGGNQADYAPQNGSSSSTKKTMVYVHDCLNTIRRVFSGGNAAAAVGVVDTIQGGRMDYVFGGGNGEVTAANIGNGGTHLVVSGGTINSLFGGSNNAGNISGQMYTEVNNESGCTESIAEFYGGCNLAPLSTNNGVYSVIKCGAGTIAEAYGGSKLADIEGDVTFDVRGGIIANVFGGSKGRAGNTPDDAADIDGNVTLNLEGGNIINAFGGSNINGNITGGITVNVIDYELEDCGLDLTNVYGGGNLTPYTPTSPMDGSVVNVMHIAQEVGIRGNVFGGGNLAAVNANAIVNIGYNAAAMEDYLPHDFSTSGLDPDEFRAFVTGNVFGGGNEAGIGSAENVFNTTVKMYDGMVMTAIYGGCNTSGTVSGNTLVELVGGTIGSANSRAGVFGGGYGQNTAVSGNVHVIFGDDSNVGNEYPILYGDLYGGSALGNVNTDNTNTTTVDILNGIITGTGTGTDFVYGNVFGGGLGQKEAEGVVAIEAKVFGKVQVNIGAPRASEQDEPQGKATLVNCNVYGCNNQNGSPQDIACVDVYQTALTDGTNGTPDNTVNGDAFAIHQVFGGGKEADYIQGKRTHVHIHYCENTIERMFGGGDASDVWGVELWFDGGRYSEVFGGGNGEVTEANITSGGITVYKGGGLIGSYFDAGNMFGHVEGNVHSEDYDGGCGEMITTDYFLGGNMHDVYGDLEIIISCGDAHNWRYKNFYGGTRLAQVYGNIHVTIRGGIFENVFGGSKGSQSRSADINDYTQEYMDENPELGLQAGDGGNITIDIYGGTIGNLFGGCDVNGSAIGKISINVKEDEEDCPLYIGNIYGGGNQTDYTPTYTQYLPTNPNALSTPEIKILKAHVGGDVPNDDQGHPVLPVINPNYQYPANVYEGNVFGGGKMGDVTANPKVILGDPEHPTTSPVTIEGNVYGGGEIGKINGSTQVIVVPTE